MTPDELQEVMESLGWFPASEFFTHTTWLPQWTVSTPVDQVLGLLALAGVDAEFTQQNGRVYTRLSP